MNYPTFTLELPDWMAGFLPTGSAVFPTVEERMRLVIDLARQNINRGSGGPFAAAIFDMETRRLLAAGVNLVTSTNCSVMHAEIVAIIMAQQTAETFDLGSADMPTYELVTSTEPCAMCMGATVWSGVRQLVCGARDEDARDIGFDEGPKVPDWPQALEARGIQVVRDVLRQEASGVLLQYQQLGGVIYNGRRDET